MSFRLSAVCLLACSLSLAACAPQGMRLVDAVEPGQFVAMSRAMRPVMLQKGLVDSHGDWYSPTLSLRPDEVGRTLVDRFSPSFLYLDSKEAVPPTFRAWLGPGTRIEYGRFKAVITQGKEKVVLELAALTDWNGDGSEDWLVRCSVSRTDRLGREREYFLCVSDFDAPVLRGRLLMEREHAFGKVAVLNYAAEAELAGNEVTEFVQGEADITLAPSASATSEDGASVKQSALSW